MIWQALALCCSKVFPIKMFLAFNQRNISGLESCKKYLKIGYFYSFFADFANKGPYSQSYDLSGSHGWMWELDHKEGWVLKNWCFQTVVLEKTVESPLDRRSNQSILKEINTEYSLEGLMPKLKLQYFGHLMRRANSLEKTLMLGKIETRRRRGW